jgi:uncharacterized protein (DUF2336 family)
MLPENFISDLEKAIAGRSADTGAMLHQITDLFMSNPAQYSTEQLDVYDDVLQTLVAKVDVAARAALAKRIAAVENAPTSTIKALATDEAIEVAEPVLSQSPVLSDDILVQCIAGRGQEHLLAIATRSTLSEEVSGHLIVKGDHKVLGAVVNNPGASISEPSFQVLVNRGADDDWLAECIAKRADIPVQHFRALVSRASEIVRQRLVASSPRQRELIDGILSRSNGSEAADEPAPVKDYRAAELVVKSHPLTEATVGEFARIKKFDEIIVAVAQMSGIPITEIERLLTHTWSSPVAVILKALGFHLPTLQAIYLSRLAAGEAPKPDFIQTKAEFIALQRTTADRIMRFYRVRKTTDRRGA